MDIKTVYVPISIGELIDKITILEIKKENITDETKIKNVERELKELKEISSKINIDPVYYDKLKEVNKKMWDVQETLRKTKGPVFTLDPKEDSELIQALIDEVKTNDERFRIKKEINLKYNSDLIEEKSYSYLK